MACDVVARFGFNVRRLLARKPADNVSVDPGPNYEPVVLPVSPLHPLLKPVVYRSREEICDTLARAANNNDLPVHFFIRLLYQESSFNPPLSARLAPSA